jgi:hypothetical protein
MSLPPLLLPRAEPWEGSTRQGDRAPGAVPVPDQRAALDSRAVDGHIVPGFRMGLPRLVAAPSTRPSWRSRPRRDRGRHPTARARRTTSWPARVMA